MASRKYSDEDYGSCRWAWENRTQGMRSAVTTLGPLTPTRASRLLHLNLAAQGVRRAIADGDFIRLSGLGVKTAQEAIRLGIPAVI